MNALLVDNSITPALTMRGSALCVRVADLHVDPHFRMCKNNHCGCNQAKKNEKAFDRNKPMEHRILEMRNEDGHPMAVIRYNMLRFRRGCPRVGADGRQ